MESLPIVTFSEPMTNEECLVILRADAGHVALGLSRRSDGDVEVLMPVAVAKDVHAQLTRALSLATNGRPG